MLLLIIAATLIVGLVSLISVILVFIKKTAPTLLPPLISLAAGSLLSVTFLDLLPEALAEGQIEAKIIFGITLISILFFFSFERILHWHHCRCEEEGKKHSPIKKNLIFINLAGDAIHNLVDGFLIASAFMLNIQTGLAVTIAVILHEIPQEISDFGILLYAGLKKGRAILYNLLVSLTAAAGAILFYFSGQVFTNLIPVVAAFAAGNFLYLATADLIPELHHETNSKKVVTHSLWLIMGVALIVIFQLITPA
ncbi:MAG: hypothetical protein A2729_00300 [Candidatus Buchananbacteria bacterium RIFCSPHIGHO2_01_FULL_39_14]|uniref:ZIP zinc transporter n=3 Tax=Parcubacteria group TaxID=1794811 RepID=A0A1F6XW14_9BACT|nr:MAG: hypothetical protein A3H53_02250 [Candidatus Nomurabacteria bacterium RIFCSPLOWO2_02_FULL_40_10]OGY45269.1 MAG: hypothetical protein A2729_00300 [Candidatus Buchananbacteria bacterium RIFCSPHIGHO2_01_FULL_39_14]OGY48757.1 MAG: hypothetical protein A3D39_04805 [Candidatus Buchananbacteria bacterium RIFCSPHIGHO2_02_FULL_39_17]OGY53530.1 MAG: hypothetical protein A2912_06115 [Candidatus Buchananbacteria bacterium RIFCSPLOWO2_01_FULL_40_23b]